MAMAFACAASLSVLAVTSPASASTSGSLVSAATSVSASASGGAPRPAVAARPRSGASYEWGVAEQAPGIATLDHNGTGQLNTVSCAVNGGCSAGGAYADGTDKTGQVFVTAETGGTWRKAQGLPSVASLNTGGSADLVAVSCAATGNCGATGYYRAGDSVHPFAVAQSGGAWDGAIAVPGTGTADSQGLAESCAAPRRCSIGGYLTGGSDREIGFLDDQLPAHTWAAALPLPGTLGSAAPAGSVAKVVSLSCRSVGNCSAGGFYTDAHDRIQAFVVDEKKGHWQSAKEVAGGLNTKGYAEITGVSCHSAGNCAAVGYYAPGTMQSRPFIVTSKNGTWGTATAVKGIAALDTGHYSLLTAVSCGPAGSAGNCTAGGSYYVAKNASQQVFTVTERNGTWGSANTISGVAARNTGKDATLAQISCVSPGNCSVAGSYEEVGDLSQVWVASQHNGSWGIAGTVEELVNLNTGGISAVTGLSCASVGRCAIVGYYYAGADDQQPFVALGSIAVPTSAALTLSAGTVVYGHEQSEKLSVKVTAANFEPLSGTVPVKAGSTVVCTITLTNGAGSCQAGQVEAQGGHVLAGRPVRPHPDLHERGLPGQETHGQEIGNRSCERPVDSLPRPGWSGRRAAWLEGSGHGS